MVKMDSGVWPDLAKDHRMTLSSIMSILGASSKNFSSTCEAEGLEVGI